jgi:hypothetical protein
MFLFVFSRKCCPYRLSLTTAAETGMPSKKLSWTTEAHRLFPVQLQSAFLGSSPLRAHDMPIRRQATRAIAIVESGVLQTFLTSEDPGFRDEKPPEPQGSRSNSAINIVHEYHDDLS